MSINNIYAPYVFSDTTFNTDNTTTTTRQLTVNPLGDAFQLDYDLDTVTPKTFTITENGMNWTNGALSFTTPLEKIGALATGLASVQIPDNTYTLDISSNIIVSNGTNVVTIDGSNAIISMTKPTTSRYSSYRNDYLQFNTADSSIYSVLGPYRNRFFDVEKDVFVDASGMTITSTVIDDRIITLNETGLKQLNNTAGIYTELDYANLNLVSSVIDKTNLTYEGLHYIGTPDSSKYIDIGTTYFGDLYRYGAVSLNDSTNYTIQDYNGVSQYTITEGVATLDRDCSWNSIIDVANGYTAGDGFVDISGTQTITGNKTFELFKIADSGNTGNYTQITPTHMNLYTGDSLTVGGKIENIIFAGNLQETQGLVTLSGTETVTGAKTFTGQSSFESFAPHCDTLATQYNDLTTKAYVDSVVGSNSGTGLLMYLDQSMDSDITGYKVLTTQYYYGEPTVYVTTASLGTNVISSFMSVAGFPNSFGSTVSAGLFNLNLYAYVSTNTGQLNCHYTINKFDTLTSTITLLATSGNSSDINGTNSSAPDLYHMPCSFPETTFLSTDRLLIILTSTGTGMGSGATLTTCFEGSYYSNLLTPISQGSGSSLTTSNNVWTGTNNFTTTLTASTASTATNDTTVANCAYVQNNLASYLTSATASSTYQTLTGMSSYLTTASASSTYQTLSGMSSYLTTASASSTYQTLSGMSSYLTTASASSTYLTKASPIVSSGNLTLPASTSILYGNTGTLSIGSSANNAGQTTGLRVPKYIDGNDLTTGMFFGYNHSGGFLRSNLAIVAGGTGTASQVYTDYISPQTSDTGTIIIGNGLSTGNITIGNSTMTGNTYIYGGYIYFQTQTTVSLPSNTFGTTQANGNSSARMATTAFVQNALASYLTTASASSTYQTIAGMTSYLTTASASSTYQTIAGMSSYATLSGATFIGTLSCPTPSPSDITTKVATTAFVNTAIGNYNTQVTAYYMPFIGGTFTGVVSGLTALTDDNSTKLATTAYVQNQGYITSADLSLYAPKLDPIFSGTIQTGNVLQNYVRSNMVTLFSETTSVITMGDACSYLTLGNQQTSNTAFTEIYGSGIFIGDSGMLNTSNVQLYATSAVQITSPTIYLPSNITQTTAGAITMFDSASGLVKLNTLGSYATAIGNTTAGVQVNGNLVTDNSVEQATATDNLTLYNNTTGNVLFAGATSNLNMGGGGVIIVPGANATFGSPSQSGNTTIQSNSTSGTIILNNPLQASYASTKLTSANYIGYSYYSTTLRSYTVSTANGQTGAFSPQSADTTPTILLPAGVYSLQINAFINFSASFQVNTYSYGIGVAYSTVQGMVLGNTTRTAFINLTGLTNYATTASTGVTSLPISCSGQFIVPVANAGTRYYAGYGILTLGATLGVGSSASLNINSCFITRIA